MPNVKYCDPKKTMEAHTRKAPKWNLISAGLQVLGVAAAIAVGQATQKAESIIALVYMVPTYACFCLLGAIAAGIALARAERWPALSFVTLFMNGIPALFLLTVIFRKVKF